MDQYVDINTIGFKDFETPRQTSSAMYIPNSTRTQIQLKKIPDDFENIKFQINERNKDESSKRQLMNILADKHLRSMSQQRSQNDQSPIQKEYPDTKKFSIEQQKDAENNDLNQNVKTSMSPLGIPYLPFAHTRNNFHLRKSDNSGMPAFGSNKSNLLTQEDQTSHNGEDETIKKYDDKIKDISSTLAKLKEYKHQLTSLQKQQQNNLQRKRSKSSINDSKFPMIKQIQPSLYFRPFESENQEQKKSQKKGKKLKQQGLQKLAEGILGGLSHEKLANLMAVNMYNKALLKKEENEEKMTSVISDQNKLLAQMMNQQDKRAQKINRKSKLSNSLLDADKLQDSRFERDRVQFSNLYSDAQQRFYQQYSSIDGDQKERSFPDHVLDTKHLKYINQHSKKYRQYIGQSIMQPPMLF